MGGIQGRQVSWCDPGFEDLIDSKMVYEPWDSLTMGCDLGVYQLAIELESSSRASECPKRGYVHIEG